MANKKSDELKPQKKTRRKTTKKSAPLEKYTAETLSIIEHNIIEDSSLLVNIPFNTITRNVLELGHGNKNITIEDGEHCYKTKNGVIKVPSSKITKANKIADYKISNAARKLLWIGLATLAASNSRELCISLKSYAILTRYIDEDEFKFNPPKATQKLKDFKKQVAKAMHELLSISFNVATPITPNSHIMTNTWYNILDSYTEPTGGKNGLIKMTFTQTLADDIKETKVFNTLLAPIFGIDNRDEFLFNFTQKVYLNYFNYSNWMHSTNPHKMNTMKVGTLMDAIGLPTPDDLKRDRSGSVEKRIIEPFMAVLDRAINNGYINDYTFVEKDGEPIGDNIEFTYNYYEFREWRIRLDITTPQKFLDKLLEYKKFKFK